MALTWRSLRIVSIWKIIFSYLGFKIFWALFLTLISGILEIFGIVLIFPLYGLLAGGNDNGLLGSGLSEISEFFGVGINFFSLTVMIVVIFSIKALILYLSMSHSAKLRSEFVLHLRLRLIEQYDRSDIELLERQSAGNFVNLITEQSGRVFTAYWLFNQSLTLLIMFLIYFFAAMVSTPVFSLILSAFGSGVVFLFSFVTRKVHELSAELAKHNGKLSIETTQYLRFFKYSRATNSAKLFSMKSKAISRDIAANQTVSGANIALADAAKEPLLLIVLLLSIAFLFKIQKIDIETILLSTVLLYRAATTLSRFQSQWQKAMEWIGSLQVIDTEIKYVSSLPRATEKKKVAVKGILLEKVTYMVPNTNTVILQDVNLTIPGPSLNCVIGPSGSGKSTFLDLILNIRQPSVGKITYLDSKGNGIDTSRFIPNFGYISQETRLIYGTLRDNITLGNNKKYNEERVLNCISLVGMEEWFLEQPNGLNTIVSEEKSNLSGGERQRLAIARELYADPDIYIFDEPTSALDERSEQQVNTIIKELSETKIVFVITHRMSIVQRCDTVFEISNKCLTETKKERFNA